MSAGHESCDIEPVQRAKAVFGSRLLIMRGGYWLDGSRILLGHLIQRMRDEDNPPKKNQGGV